MCPVSRRFTPSPLPRRWPTALGRPASTHCSSVSRPSLRMRATRYWATPISPPVGLAMSTRSISSGRTQSAVMNAAALAKSGWVTRASLETRREQGLTRSARTTSGPSLFGRRGLEKFGRRRDELLHARHGIVPAHVFEQQPVDARILVLVLDLIAPILEALGDCRRVALLGAEQRHPVGRRRRVTQAAPRGGE